MKLVVDVIFLSPFRISAKQKIEPEKLNFLLSLLMESIINSDKQLSDLDSKHEAPFFSMAKHIQKSYQFFVSSITPLERPQIL